ncbi:MAG: hypothetical protein ACEQR8_09030, partial [Cypionkella sp.]
MTEHSKIPLPGGDKRPAPSGSLLERASGSFALDPFRPAAVPAQLEDRKIFGFNLSFCNCHSKITLSINMFSWSFVTKFDRR